MGLRAEILIIHGILLSLAGQKSTSHANVKKLGNNSNSRVYASEKQTS